MPRSEQEKQRCKRNLLKLRQLLGGKCSWCGAIESLEFDHIDPNTKLFNIPKGVKEKSFDRVLREARKCQLLCFNCHSVKSSVDSGHGNSSPYHKGNYLKGSALVAFRKHCQMVEDRKSLVNEGPGEEIRKL